MKYKALMLSENPLETLLEDGGFTGIFRTIGCVGDSLSSGEFEALDDDGTKSYHDYYDYSWGQYMARTLGNRVYNFSRGGMTAKEYVQAFADENHFWDKEYVCQAYIIALGVNDLVNERSELGSFEDVCLSDYTKNNTDTFIGAYAYIISRLQELQPKAKFFLMSMPKENDEKDEIRVMHRELLYQFQTLFKNVYILDFYRYAPIYDQAFKERYYSGHHLNPMGYLLTSKMVMTYMNFIIVNHYRDFKEVGFIGTDLSYEKKHD